MCQILYWNHVGRLVLAIKPIPFVIDFNFNIKTREKTCMHFPSCIFINVAPIFILQWCIKLLNYYGIDQHCYIWNCYNNCITLNEAYLKTNSFFSPNNYLHAHKKSHVIMNFHVIFENILK